MTTPSVRRFDLHGEEGCQVMRPDQDGDYVLYADHDAVVQQQATVERERDELYTFKNLQAEAIEMGLKALAAKERELSERAADWTAWTLGFNKQLAAKEARVLELEKPRTVSEVETHLAVVIAEAKHLQTERDTLQAELARVREAVERVECSFHNPCAPDTETVGRNVCHNHRVLQAALQPSRGEQG